MSALVSNLLRCLWRFLVDIFSPVCNLSILKFKNDGIISIRSLIRLLINVTPSPFDGSLVFLNNNALNLYGSVCKVSKIIFSRFLNSLSAFKPKSGGNKHCIFGKISSNGNGIRICPGFSLPFYQLVNGR